MTHSDDESKADCYSSGDRKFMVATQKIRAVILRPFLSVLTKSGVTADLLTFISLVTGLSACIAYFHHRWLFLLLILAHVLLDGLDGPLARYQNKASRKGSFADTVSDQIVVAATTITLIYAKVVGVIPGSVYVFVYTVVIAFSVVRNAMKTPYSWLLRPRFPVYAWFAVEFYLWPGTVNYALWFFSAILTLKMFSGFQMIRRKL